jgi:hypothetical protein
MRARRSSDPPMGDDVVKRMLASGNWKLGPNGELLRVSAEEANQAAYEASLAQAMEQLAEENPAKYKPTTSGFMTPERKEYLNNLDRPLTPEEAREWATVSFDPSEGANVLFSMVAPAGPVEELAARGIASGLKGLKVIKSSKPGSRLIKTDSDIDPMVARAAEKQGRDRLQNVADRIIRGADKEYHQDLFNTQRRIEQLIQEGKMEWDEGIKLLEQQADDIINQAATDYRVLGPGDRLDNPAGPALNELYHTDKAAFNEAYNDLFQPIISRKIDGRVNPRMNEFGGRVPLSPMKVRKR